MQSTKFGDTFKSDSDQILNDRTKSFRINPKKILFYSVFIMVFVLSGTLTLVNLFPYRMGIMSLISIPLRLWRKDESYIYCIPCIISCHLDFGNL